MDSHAVSLLVAVTLVLTLLVTPPALAVTNVGGDTDASSPLVIDPSTTDPLDPLALNATSADMFIQKMPVTKSVKSVTIGDLARASDCTQDVVLQLYIREHPNGDADDSQQVSYGLWSRTAGATPGKVTFTIPTTTLYQGRGYTFRVNWAGGCWQFKYTTWAHNNPEALDVPRVNAGPKLCANVGGSKRMWHQATQLDKQPVCTPDIGSRFNQDMPTGWLVSIAQGSTFDVATSVRYAVPPTTIPDACPQQKPGGAVQVKWSEGPEQWICHWPQFAPPGVNVSDGWYYALPWRTERSGSPRDMYLRLDTTG